MVIRQQTKQFPAGMEVVHVEDTSLTGVVIAPALFRPSDRLAPQGIERPEPFGDDPNQGKIPVRWPYGDWHEDPEYLRQATSQVEERPAARRGEDQ